MDDWFDRDRRRRRKDFFDVFDEIFKEINRMLRDMIPEDFMDESNVRGFSIYMGPEGIDIRDLSGRPIGGKFHRSFEEVERKVEEKLDYDVIREGDKYVYYIDLRIGKPSELDVYKEGDRIIVVVDGKTYIIPVDREITKFNIEDYQFKNGILKIILGRKKGLFRF